MENSLAISAKLDRTLAWERGDSVRYLVVDLAAPGVERSQPGTRTALNLGLVLDASGSMSGPRLTAAKEAAIGVVKRLQDGDTVSIVSFDHNVSVHIDGVVLDEAARSQVIEQVGRIEAGGNTNLSGGWLAGAQCVANVMEVRPGLRNRVVLLSDGHANAGVTEPEVLEHHAAQLASRGLFTSTVGIGDDYSPVQLHAIAEFGGGRMHDAEFAHEIVEVMMAELDDALVTAAEDVTVEVGSPPGVRLEAVSTFPTVISPGAIESRLGSLISKASRTAVFRITMPAGRAGDTVTLTASARWKRPGTADNVTTGQVPSALTFASGTDNSAQPRDPEVSLAVVTAWQGAIVRRVAHLNAEGALREGQRYLEREVGFFRRYCHGLPGAEPLLEDLDRVQRAAAHRWSPRANKEVMMSMSERSYNRRSARSAAPADWTSFIEDSPAGDQPRKRPSK